MSWVEEKVLITKLCKCGNKIHCKGLCRKCYEQLPYIKAMKKEYRERPDRKARAKALHAKHYNELENIKRRLQYAQQSEVKAKILEYSRRPENKVKALKRQQQPEVKIKLKKYRERPDRKIIAKKYQKIYYDIPTNKEKSRWYQRQEKYKIKKNKRHNIRYKNDILYNLKNKMRGRLKIFFKLKNIPKRKSTMKIVGCSPQELKQHIEKQFDKNMNWGLVLNGEIHIDHDTPLDTAKTEEDVYRLFHYSNLQPLLAKDNLSKGAKLNWIKPDNRIKSDK